jgi:hypothetical protein
MAEWDKEKAAPGGAAEKSKMLSRVLPAYCTFSLPSGSGTYFPFRAFPSRPTTHKRNRPFHQVSVSPNGPSRPPEVPAEGR